MSTNQKRQWFFGLELETYTQWAHYTNFLSEYHLTEEEFLNLDEYQDVSAYNASTRTSMGDTRFVRLNGFGTPDVVDDALDKKDSELILGITISGGGSGKSQTDSKVTAKYTTVVSIDMINALKLMQKTNPKMPTGKGIDWGKWKEGETIHKISEYLGKNMENAEGVYKEYKKGGGKPDVKIYKWGEKNSSGGRKIDSGDKALYSPEGFEISENGKAIYNVESNKIVVVPEGYEIYQVESGGQRLGITKK